MVKNIYIETLPAGATGSTRIRLSPELQRLKGIVVSGRKVEISAGNIRNRTLLHTAVSGSSKTGPDQRVIPFDYHFEANDILFLTVRNHYNRPQQITINLITA